MHLRRLHLFERLKRCLRHHGILPHRSGQLFLNNKGITGLRDGVFNNMGACTYLYLYHNQLGQSKLPGSIFNGLICSELYWAVAGVRRS